MRARGRLKRLEDKAAGAAVPVPSWLDDDAPWKTLDGDGRVRELDSAEIEEARESVRCGESLAIKEHIDIEDGEPCR